MGHVFPLARLLDFVPEDVDAMCKELEMWRNETQLNVARLQTEERSDACGLYCRVCNLLVCPSVLHIRSFLAMPHSESCSVVTLRWSCSCCSLRFVD